MLAIDLRLKIRHWFKKYKNVVLVVLLIWLVIFMVNKYLIATDNVTVPETTYEPSVQVMNPGQSAPKRVQNTAEEAIEEYVGYCNEGNYAKAFAMLSKDCQEYAFNNSVDDFADHVLKKMITPKEYSIQNYSKHDDYYIYEVKYIDNILATGLTNQTYNYSTEKIVLKENKGQYELAVGNFIKHDNINNVLENDYLKVDVIDRITRYSIETYTVKFTNRTDSTVVISDTLIENEIMLVLPQEYRNLENSDTRIILEPGESRTFNLTFPKFVDDGDISQAILFSAVRVIENYKGIDGTDAERQAEIDNAIAKFSVEIPLRQK